MNMWTKAALSAGLGSALTIAGVSAYAAGFQLYEQNASGTGDYHAGGAAEANDASAVWYNPAGLTRLHKKEVIGGTAVLAHHATFKGNVSVTDALDTTQGPTQSQATTSVIRAAPFGYIAAPLNDKWAAGFGIASPFGLETNYGFNSDVKYAATKSSLMTVDLTPVIAYQVNRVLSIGFGLDALYANGEFDGVSTSPTYNEFYHLDTDTSSTNYGNGWGFGYHFGTLFQFTPNTRVGFSYHSQIALNLQGNSKFVGPLAHVNGDLQPIGGTTESNRLKASFTLPAYALGSIYHDINQQWSVMGSAMYTFWDSFGTLKLQNVAATAGLPGLNSVVEEIIQENYQNSWNIALGVHYSPTQKLTLKLGTGFDASPTTNQYRNVQLPDATRIALAGGAHYQITQNVSVDGGYAHLFIHNTPINVTETAQNNGSTVNAVETDGAVKSFANILGLQVAVDF